MPRHPALLPACVLALVLGVGAAALRVPYVALVPGPVTDTLGKRSDGVPIITVSGHPTYPTSGELDLTTVGVRGGPSDPLTAGLAVRWWFDAHKAVVPESLLFPAGETAKMVEQENAREMEDSQQEAVAAALRTLHVPVSTYVVVADVGAGTPAAGRLKAGDQILAINGAPVQTAAQLRARLGKVTPGSVVRLTIRRAGTTSTVPVRTGTDPQHPGRAFLGVYLGERHRFPFTVSINLKDVGGPSAGQMFALGIIDKLTPGSLTGGRHIAGTGTIDDSGQIGPIGGVQQKIAAAKADGARYFLTPTQNCAAAAKVRPAGLTLVRVSKLSESLDQLAAIRAGRGVWTC